MILGTTQKGMSFAGFAYAYDKIFCRRGILQFGWGCFWEYLLLTLRKGVIRMKWLDIAIKILHIIAIIGTYAATFEALLTAIRAVLTFLGF